MKKSSALLVCGWWLLASVSMAQQAGSTLQQADRIVAVVNGNVITQGDVTRQLGMMIRTREINIPGTSQEEKLAAFDSMRNELFVQVLRQMIDQEVIYAECQRQEITLPSEALEQTVAREVGRLTDGDWDAYRQLLAKEGMTIQDRRERLHKDIIVRQYVNMMVEKRVQISPSQVREYYLQNPALFQIPAKVRLQLIILDPQRHDQAAMEAKVQAISKGLAEGTDFLELAKTYSDGPDKAHGEDVGWLNVPADIAEPIRQALPSFDKGRIVGPVKIGAATCFIHVADVQSHGSIAFDEARPRIEAVLHEQEAQKRLVELINRLRRKVAIRFPGD